MASKKEDLKEVIAEAFNRTGAGALQEALFKVADRVEALESAQEQAKATQKPAK